MRVIRSLWCSRRKSYTENVSNWTSRPLNWERLARIQALLFVAALLSFSAANAESGSKELVESEPSATAQEAPAKQDAPAKPAITYPAFQNIRYDEDWSALKNLADPTGYEQLKYIRLNDSGSVYLSVGGQYRLRAEQWWNFGFGGPGNRDDGFGLSRLRLHGDLHLGNRMRVFVEGKSALSTERNLPGGQRTLDVDTIDLQNALVDIKASLEPVAVTFRLGRQELQFGKQRLVSPLDWSNTRRTWDGARVIVQKEGFRIDGFWSQYAPVRKYSFNCSDSDQFDFYGIYATNKLGASGHSMDVYWLGTERIGAVFGGVNAIEKRQTIGTRFGGPLGASSADYDVEGAYQFGDHGVRDISAFMFAGQLGYAFKETAGKPRVYVNLDYASGDDDPLDTTVGTFNQVFPLGHAYLGFIDIIGRQNIIDWSFGLSATPVGKLALKVDVHNFWRASANDALYNAGGGLVRGGLAGTSERVGSEVDFTAAYPVNRYLALTAGYSFFAPGSFIDESGASDTNHFVYGMIQTTF